MQRTFHAVAALAVCAALAVAGCGSSKHKSSSAVGGGATTTSTTTTTKTSTSGAGSTNSPVAQAAKRGCEAAIQNNPALAADKRTALSAECQKLADAAASGDKAKYKAEYGVYCDKLAGALPAAAQSAAKSACQQGANAIK